MIGTVFPFRPWWAPLPLPCKITERQRYNVGEGKVQTFVDAPYWRFTHWWPGEIPEEMRVRHGLIDEGFVRRALAEHDGVYLTPEMWSTRAGVEWFRDTVRSGLPLHDSSQLLRLARMELVPQEMAA